MFPFVTRRGTKRIVRRAASRIAKTLTPAGSGTRKAARSSAAPSGGSTLAGMRAKMRAGAVPEGPAPGRFVEVDGVRVHYIARGKGRPVVLIHGNGTMAEDFVLCGLLDRLAARYRVIAVDRPGFGHSPRPRHRLWTAAVQAGFLDRVLARLKVENPLVVGHSWGTLVALALATGGSRELRGLVLLSGYFYPSRRADVTLSAPLALPGFGDAARSLIPRAMGRALAAQSFRHVFRPQPVPARFTARFPVEIATGATQMRAATEDAATMNNAAAVMEHRYRRLRMPVAILAGDADAVVEAEEQSVRLHGEIAGSTLKRLPGIGHMTHYAARLQVERAIDGLMKPGTGPRTP